jgi:hypothetical protein
VGKRNREKSRQRPSLGPAAPEPTARPRGSVALRIGVYLACLIVFHIWDLALTTDPSDQERYTPQKAAHHLRYSSVYSYPLSIAGPALDTEEATMLIGDRPLVAVAGFPTMCTEIAEELPGVIVVVVNSDSETPIVDCAHKDSFHDPALLRDVQDTTAYLVTGDDRTAYLAEYVRAFDERHPSLRRTPSGDDDLAGDLIIVVPLLVALSLATFGAIALRRAWHTTNTRLNRLANRLTHDDTSHPHERAATANEYLHTLRDFEYATSKEQRVTTEQRLTTLEQATTERQSRTS